jgi:endonuclease-3
MTSKLARVVAALREQHGAVAAPPTTNAFELLLWEYVAYLATDDRRGAAFNALRRRVGLTPQAILEAKLAVLHDIAASGGGTAVDDRVRHMQDAAAIVVDEFDGSLDAVLSLPLPDAMRALQRFHGIGEPGAERILLLTRSQALLPLDSNGARVLVRIGYGVDHKSYTAMYRSVREATRPEIVSDVEWLIDAHVVLRRHGQEICRRSSPRCDSCAARAMCAHAQR